MTQYAFGYFFPVQFFSRTFFQNTILFWSSLPFKLKVWYLEYSLSTNDGTKSINVHKRNTNNWYYFGVEILTEWLSCLHLPPLWMSDTSKTALTQTNNTIFRSTFEGMERGYLRMWSWSTYVFWLKIIKKLNYTSLLRI